MIADDNKNSVGQADKYGWRFYEIEKRSEELEKMLIAHRRFTVFSLATLHVVSLTIALWVFRLHWW